MSAFYVSMEWKFFAVRWFSNICFAEIAKYINFAILKGNPYKKTKPDSLTNQGLPGINSTNLETPCE